MDSNLTEPADPDSTEPMNPDNALARQGGMGLPPHSQEKQDDESQRAEFPNADLPIAKLPVEMLLEISDRLPPAGRVLLSQTCASFRRILARYGTASHLYTSIPRYRYLDFLYTVVRDRRDAWVCDLCFCLHPVTYTDTPPEVSSDNAQLFGCAYAARELYLPRPSSGFSRSSDKHVHIALRLSRMQSSCSPEELDYLRRLLKPYCRFHREYDNFYMGNCHPKIVDVDGAKHYMVRCTMRFDEFQGLTTSAIHSFPLDLCLHQALRRQKQDEGIVSQILPRTRPWGRSVISPAALDDPTTAAAVVSGGGCKHCLSDFAIEYEDGLDEVIKLTVWQSFGTEAAPSSIVSRARHSPSFGGTITATWDPIVPWGSEREIPRQAGWVRDTYEKENQDDRTPAWQYISSLRLETSGSN